MNRNNFAAFGCDFRSSLPQCWSSFDYFIFVFNQISKHHMDPIKISLFWLWLTVYSNNLPCLLSTPSTTYSSHVFNKYRSILFLNVFIDCILHWQAVYATSPTSWRSALVSTRCLRASRSTHWRPNCGTLRTASSTSLRPIRATSHTDVSVHLFVRHL